MKFKIKVIEERGGYNDDEEIVAFTCPGCKVNHEVLVRSDFAEHTWNGDRELPTITGEMVFGSEKADQTYIVCRCAMRGGTLHFHESSDHHLKGQSVEMIAYSERPWDLVLKTDPVVPDFNS